MNTTEWEFDFSSLPNWDNRETMWVYDEYFELPQSDTLCCIYSICEVTMLNDLGFLAILRNKEAPELIVNVAKGCNFSINFSASDDGTILFLQPHIYDRSRNRSHRPILILDIENNRFSYLKTDNLCPAYRVIQKKENVFVIEADARQRKGNKHLAALHGKKIRIRWLRWYAMDKLPELPQMINTGDHPCTSDSLK